MRRKNFKTTYDQQLYVLTLTTIILQHPNPYQIRTSWCKEEKVILLENRFARRIGINHMTV